MTFTSSRHVHEEMQEVGRKAKSLVEKCRDEGREWTRSEKGQYESFVNELRRLQVELAEAKATEQTLKDYAMTNKPFPGQRGTWNTSDSTNPKRPQLQTPFNGVHPDEPGGWNTSPHYSRYASLKAFPDEESAFKSGKWLQAVVARTYDKPDYGAHDYLQRIGWNVTAAGGGDSGPAGGYTVPSPMSTAIIDVRERTGIARRVCRIMPMSSDTLDIPRRAGGLTVYVGGENPSADMTDSDKSWEQIALVAKKRYAVHILSSELVDDAIINIVDDAASEIGHALAREEDRVLVAGTGISTDGGVRGLLNLIGSAGVVDAATNHNTWGELDFADITACMGRLPDKYSTIMPSWICSSAFYMTVLLRLQAAAGGNAFSSIQEGDRGVRTFLGYDVFFSEDMPKTEANSQVCLLFGSFPQAVILGDRLGLRIARSDDYLFLRDQVAIKGVSRYDINVHSPGDASNAGGYVALRTAAS